MTRFFDEEEILQFQEDLVNMALFDVDEQLRKLGGRALLPASEVVDALLDLRQILDTYYVHQRSPT